MTGEAATTVEHPLEWTAVEVDGKDRGSGLVMPEGTHFAVDARVVAGGTYRLHLGLANRSTRRQVAILEIDAPEALALKMTPYKGRSEQVEVVSLSGNRWAVGLPPETDDSGADAYELTVSVSVPVQALPGKATLGFTAEPADIESLQ